MVVLAVSIEASLLVDAIRSIGTIVDPEALVLLSARGDSLIVEAGKNAVYFRSVLPVSLTEEGTICVKRSYLARLRFPKAAEVTLVATDKQLTFKSKGFKGTVSLDSDGIEEVEGQRPDTFFDTIVTLPTDAFKNAAGRVNISSAIPNASMGVRIQTGKTLTMSATDSYRALLFKEKLAVEQPSLDVLLKPSFLQAFLGRATDGEVYIGVEKGTIRMSTFSMDVFHPVIQTEPEEIEDYIENVIDYNSRKCYIETEVEDFTDALLEASSITSETLGFDTYVDLLVKSNKVIMKVQADHGDAQALLTLKKPSSSAKFKTKLSSKYTLEIIRLVKGGAIEISFWKEMVLIKGHGNRFVGMLPTVAL